MLSKSDTTKNTQNETSFFELFPGSISSRNWFFYINFGKFLSGYFSLCKYWSPPETIKIEYTGVSLNGFG